MKNTEPNVALAEARRLAALLIQEAHQLPIDLSLAFDGTRVARTCERIEKLARGVADHARKAGEVKEFRE